LCQDIKKPLPATVCKLYQETAKNQQGVPVIDYYTIIRDIRRLPKEGERIMTAAGKPFLNGYKIGGLIDKITKHEPQSCEGSGAAEGYVPEPPTVSAIVNASPQPSEYPVEQAKEGLFEIFTIGDLTYRLGGVKPLFVTNLRVNIRVRFEDKNYYDSLDLYLARSRSAFAQAAEHGIGAESARVERDLVRILERLEISRDAALTRTTRKDENIITEEERRMGMELLTDPDLFKRITEDLSSLGYVGEDLNKQLLYLCASSRKRNNPLSVLILSQSASGKSYLVDCVRRLMPEDEVIAVTSLSDQALNYLSDLEHKFLILGEAVHSEAVEYQIREMLSGKELSRLVVEKDPESGRMESRMMKMRVIVSSVMGSTAGKVNPENASRCFVIHADESREQTEMIHSYQRKRKSLEYLASGSAKIKKTIKTHVAAQRLLRNIPVVNDFASFLDFPAALMRSRRDHDRFLDLIDAVCFLRQYQKKTEDSELYSADGVSFIRCDVEDYEIAYKIMVDGVLSSTMEELPKGARLLYEQIRGWVRSESNKRKLGTGELRFTQRQIREATGLGHTWVKAMIHYLIDYEYLEVVSGGGQRSKAWYILRNDEEILRTDFSMIPPPEAIGQLYKSKKDK
jgi:hypothetical protein